eukprot:2243556-Rhodomonas_salina.1
MTTVQPLASSCQISRCPPASFEARGAPGCLFQAAFSSARAGLRVCLPFQATSSGCRSPARWYSLR